jgi:hypothetical protein
METDKIQKLIVIACIVGFVGDFLLQLFSKKFGMGGPTGWGLKDYFSQHGSVEALFIAGGMMTLFYIIYLVILKLPVNYYYLAIYGIILDLLFRIFMIFPSLSGYYNYFGYSLGGYIGSGFWEAFSICLPLFIYQLIPKN